MDCQSRSSHLSEAFKFSFFKVHSTSSLLLILLMALAAPSAIWANSAPVLPPFDEQSVTVGELVSVRVAPTDPDGIVPGVYLPQPPRNYELADNRDGTRLFKWTPTYADIGTHRFEVTTVDAEDTSLRSSQFLTVNVRDDGGTPPPVTPTPPVLPPFETQTIQVGETISVTVAPTDPDGTVPGVYPPQPPAGSEFTDNRDGTRNFIWTPTAENVGTTSIDFVSIDANDSSLRTTQTLTIVVQNGGGTMDPPPQDPPPQDPPPQDPPPQDPPPQDPPPQDPPTQDPPPQDPPTQDPPPPPPDPSVITAADVPASRADASRFLQRTSFGPKRGDVDQLMGVSYGAWVDQQLALPPTRHLNRLDTRLSELGLLDVTSGSGSYIRRQARRDVWWDIAVNGRDQLRQRVAFALSQLLVISDNEGSVTSRVRGVTSYTDVLVENAFGNYRDLLTEVTLHPMMGNFLSMRRNEKANVARNIQPDENYARELMQLFTIGLDPLYPNGQVNPNTGQRSAYTQDDVMNFARVFTGWNYGDADRMRTSRRTTQSEVIPMKAFEDYHDTDAKTLLNGVSLPAGQTARQDLDAALDNLFNHPNVGPFVSKRLIQRLVTSNPSPSYVNRVTQMFNNNGQGVRGDLGAVVKAILLDEDALNGFRTHPGYFGKLKEPLVKIASIWRALEAKGEFGRLRYSDVARDFAQDPLGAPSVFNFYSPTYAPPSISTYGLVTPEFQILNENTILRGADRMFDFAFNLRRGSAPNSSKHRIDFNLGPLLALAPTPEALVDELNDRLLAGRMLPGTRNALITLVTDTPLEEREDPNGTGRVYEALYMVFLSPEFAFQR